MPCGASRSLLWTALNHCGHVGRRHNTPGLRAAAGRRVCPGRPCMHRVASSVLDEPDYRELSMPLRALSMSSRAMALVAPAVLMLPGPRGRAPAAGLENVGLCAPAPHIPVRLSYIVIQAVRRRFVRAVASRLAQVEVSRAGSAGRSVHSSCLCGQILLTNSPAKVDQGLIFNCGGGGLSAGTDSGLR